MCLLVLQLKHYAQRPEVSSPRGYVSKTNISRDKQTLKEIDKISLISELSVWRGLSNQTLWLFIQSLLSTWGWWPLAAAPTQSITVHFESRVTKSCRHVDPQLCDISHNLDFWLWNWKNWHYFHFCHNLTKFYGYHIFLWHFFVAKFSIRRCLIWCQ